MREGHVTHISGVVQVAANAVPGLSEDVRYKPSAKNQRGFRTAVGGMAAAAEANKDVLVKFACRRRYWRVCGAAWQSSTPVSRRATKGGVCT